MKKKIALLFVCLFAASLCACGEDSHGQTSTSSKVLSWQDLKTADQIEERNTIDPKFLNDTILYDRTNLYSRLSERPFQDHLSFFPMNSYIIEGKYIMQTGDAEQSNGETISRQEYQFPDDLNYQLRLSDNYSIRRFSYTNDITQTDPEYADEFGFDLSCTRDLMAIVNQNNSDDFWGFLGFSVSFTAVDAYGYVYRSNDNNYLIHEELVYENNPFIINQDTVSRVIICNLDSLDKAQGDIYNALIFATGIYCSDAGECRIVMSTGYDDELLYSDYDNLFSYNNEDAVYESIRDAETYIDNYLNDLSIARKLFDFQTEKKQDLERTIPLYMYRWTADQDLLDSFNNTERIPGVTQESPAEFSLIFGHQ